MPSNTGYAQIKYDVREPKPSLPAQQYHPDGSAEKYGMIRTNLKVIKSESSWDGCTRTRSVLFCTGAKYAPECYKAGIEFLLVFKDFTLLRWWKCSNVHFKVFFPLVTALENGLA